MLSPPSLKNDSTSSKFVRSAIPRGRQGRRLLFIYFGILGSISLLGIVGFHRMSAINKDKGTMGVPLIDPAVSTNHFKVTSEQKTPHSPKICNAKNSLFHSDTWNTDDHRGGERLSSLALPYNDARKAGQVSNGGIRLSLMNGEVHYKGRSNAEERSIQSTMDDILAQNPSVFRPKRRERYLTPDVSASDAGGNAYFEEVTEGNIPSAADQKTNAVAWGDSKPQAAWRNQGGFGGIEWPRKPFKTIVKEYSEEELLAMHHTMDIVVSYVNGSDPIHRFHKLVLDNVVAGLLSRRGGGWYPTQTESGRSYPLNNLTNLENYLSGSGRLTTTMDREHDELRYNFRSLQQNLKWHCGRLMILSDANIPSWLNRARNFFMTSLPQYPNGRRHPLYGKRCLNGDTRRVIVIHQDAVLPMGERYTFDTNTIEMFIYRIRRLSDLYIHYNDDYLTRKETNVTTFVNKKGGAILRFEDSSQSRFRYGKATVPGTNGWAAAVYHTNGFIEEALGDNIVDEDPFVPSTRRRVLADAGGEVRAFAAERRLIQVGGGVLTGAGSGEVDHSFAFSDLRNSPMWPRPRFFLKHAPFVMCRNMFRRHLLPYYSGRLTRAGLELNHRSLNDYIPPQTHHAFLTDVPWAGSAKFTPDYMLSGMRRAIDGPIRSQWDREKLMCGAPSQEIDEKDMLTIRLDNHDGCAPAQLLIGSYATANVVTFTDDAARNARLLDQYKQSDPIFLTINDNGYTKQEVEDQVMGLLSGLFPSASMAEDPRMALEGERKSLGRNNNLKMEVRKEIRPHPNDKQPQFVPDEQPLPSPPPPSQNKERIPLDNGNQQVTPNAAEEEVIKHIEQQIDEENKAQQRKREEEDEAERLKVIKEGEIPPPEGEGSDALNIGDFAAAAGSSSTNRKLQQQSPTTQPTVGGTKVGQSHPPRAPVAVESARQPNKRRQTIYEQYATIEEDPLYVKVAADGTTEVVQEEEEDVFHSSEDSPSSFRQVTPGMQLFYDRRYRQFNQLPMVLLVNSALHRVLVCAFLRSLQLALPDYEGNVAVVTEGYDKPLVDQTSYPERCVITCRTYNKRVRNVRGDEKLGPILQQMRLPVAEGEGGMPVGPVGGAPPATINTTTTPSTSPSQSIPDRPRYNNSPFLASIDAIMIRLNCLTVLGQTLALEDFAEVEDKGGMRFLYLEAPCPVREDDMEPEDMDPTSVNWVLAPSVWALLQSYPIPYRNFEPSEELVYTY